MSARTLPIHKRPWHTAWRAMLRRRPLLPRASAALSVIWGRGCAPQKSDDTEVVPPVLLRARRVSAQRKPWRAMLRRRPLLPRASAALSVIWGRGCAPQKSDDTEVVPPVLLRARRVSAQRNPLEGDAPSAPTFPARQRGFIGGMGAGLRPAEVGRHGGRPSSFVTSAAREQNDDSRLPRRNGLG